MPRYTYTCEKCYWEGTRVVKFEERDDLICNEVVRHRTYKDAEGKSKTVPILCGGKLKRAEIETTSFTPHFWQP